MYSLLRVSTVCSFGVDEASNSNNKHHQRSTVVAHSSPKQNQWDVPCAKSSIKNNDGGLLARIRIWLLSVVSNSHVRDNVIVLIKLFE